MITWNIRAGGGRRTDRIVKAIAEERPDVVVLTEFRTMPGRMLFEGLPELPFRIQAGSDDAPKNRVCVLSRTPLTASNGPGAPKSAHRWQSVEIPEHGVSVLAVHVPNQHEVWDKRDFWSRLEAYAGTNVRNHAAIVGDLNTALDEDCEGAPIREAVSFQRLLDSGWVDAWRRHNADGREFTWYSHRQNGFRLDHCLVSLDLAGRVRGSKLRHDVRTEGLSDHSMLTVDFGL